LVRLVGLLPQQPDWLAEETSSPDVTNLVKRDIHSSGLIAERWLEMLRQKLVHLGLATPDESSKQN
jgi:hypothetical protein